MLQVGAKGIEEKKKKKKCPINPFPTRTYSAAISHDNI
jgi:hypothetical protein